MWQSALIKALSIASSVVPVVHSLPTSALNFHRSLTNSDDAQKPLRISGFPVPDPTEAYWQNPPHRIANHRTTPELPISEIFDYVIIGSGVSGAATAHKLLSRNANLSILMLEARTAASGATGRNGGHCRPSAWKNAKKWVDMYGEEEALRIGNMEQDCVDDVAEFVRSHNVSSDFTDVESADIYYTREAFETALEQVEYLHELEDRIPDHVPKNNRTVYEGQEARDYWGWPEIIGAVTFTAHTQNPYLTVCAMLELSLNQGLNLQTNTLALSLEQLPEQSPDGTKWHVKTDRGTVKGRQIVLATNGFTNALHPGLRSTNFLTPSRSQVAAVYPEADTSGNPVFERSNSYPDLHSGNNYIAARPPGSKGEGDVMIGGSTQLSPTKELNTTDDSVINEQIATALHGVGRFIYGHENWGQSTTVIGDWTGITCETPDGFPVVGEVPSEDGLWAIVCMNGHGMAWAYRSAEALVDMMTTDQAPEWFPKSFSAQRAWESN